jgi:hypothetical protein
MSSDDWTPSDQGDALSGDLTLEWDEASVELYEVALATGPAWWETAYPGGKPAGPAKLVRALFYPGNPSAKPPSLDGPDVLAVKRAVWRGGRWPGPASSFDDSFSKMFALGRGGNVVDTGLAGFQRQMKIQATGQMGDETYQALRYAHVPEGLPHAGEPLFDATAVELLQKAANPPPPANADAVRDLMADYCRRTIEHAGAWHYRQARPMETLGVKPEAGGYNDCSEHATAVYFWAGAPDPNHRGYDGYGYTGTLISNPATLAPYKIGDLALYGPSTGASSHVTTCYAAGNDATARWCSNGSESAPVSVSLFYRDDLLVVVRPGVS